MPPETGNDGKLIDIEIALETSSFMHDVSRRVFNRCYAPGPGGRTA